MERVEALKQSAPRPGASLYTTDTGEMAARLERTMHQSGGMQLPDEAQKQNEGDV